MAAHSAAHSIEEMSRVFNSAVIETRGAEDRDLSAELLEIMKTPAFKAILQSVRQHALLEGITEKLSAEQIIGTFRRIDRVWTDYLLLEGLERARGQQPPRG